MYRIEEKSNFFKSVKFKWLDFASRDGVLEVLKNDKVMLQGKDGEKFVQASRYY